MRLKDGILELTRNEYNVYSSIIENKTQTNCAAKLNLTPSYICQICKNLISINALIVTTDQNKRKHYSKTPTEFKISIKEVDQIKRKKNKKWKRLNTVTRQFSRCKYCKKRILRGKKYCNRQCRGKHQSGPNHPGWKRGKIYDPYCWKFNDELKIRVRTFFNYECFLCGSVGDDHSLEVHHVLYNKRACCDGTGIALLVPLCESCHGRTTPKKNRNFWQTVIAYQVMKRTGGKCYFTRDEMANLKNQNRHP